MFLKLYDYERYNKNQVAKKSNKHRGNKLKSSKDQMNDLFIFSYLPTLIHNESELENNENTVADDVIDQNSLNLKK